MKPEVEFGRQNVYEKETSSDGHWAKPKKEQDVSVTVHVFDVQMSFDGRWAKPKTQDDASQT